MKIENPQLNFCVGVQVGGFENLIRFRDIWPENINANQHHSRIFKKLEPKI